MGVGGIGKTALALYIMKHEAVRAKFGDKSYFVPCEIFSDASSLIQGMLQALKLSVTEGHDPYETLQRYLKLSQNPILLVLDNFETPWNHGNQIATQNLIEWIWDLECVSIVLTMRAANGPGARNWYKLGGQSGLPTLELEPARQAFMLISNSHSEDVLRLDWLLKEVDCMPLAILLVAQLRRQLSLESLTKRWNDQKTSMLKIAAGSSRQNSVSVSIEITLQTLLISSNADCVQILPKFSFLPNGVPLWEETLKKLVVELEVDLEMSVMALLDSSIIYDENNCLKMLSPIREYLQTKYPTKHEHVTKMGKYYSSLLRDHSPGQGQDIIEMHTSNIKKVLQRLLHSRSRRNYLDCLGAIYDFSQYGKFSQISFELIGDALTQTWDGSYEEEVKLGFARGGRLSWMGYHEMAISEIKTIQLRLKDMNDIHNNARCLTRLGYICRMQDKYSEARLLFTEAKTQFDKVDNQLGAAQCIQSLGIICTMQDEYSEAKLLLTEAKAQFEKIGNQIGAAQCIQSLGNICTMKNEHSVAKLLLTEAKTQFEKVGNQLGDAQCVQRLGDISTMQNDYSKAKLLLTEAKIQFEKVGSQLGAAQCIQSLGNICRMQSEHFEAKLLLTDAKTQFEKLGSQFGAAQCIQILGYICIARHEYSEAKLLFTGAKTQFERVGNQLEAAQCIQSLGDIYKMQNEYSEARLLLTEAKIQFDKVGSQLGATQCLQWLGDICTMQDTFSEARLLLTKARNQFEKLGNRLGAAQCIQSLGDLCLGQDVYSEAKSLLTEAKTLFEKVGDRLGAAQCTQSLGNISRMQNVYSEAKLLLTEANTQFQKFDDQFGAAQCIQSLGDICRTQHKYSKAKFLLTKAKTKFEKVGNQFGAAQCTHSLDAFSYWWKPDVFIHNLPAIQPDHNLKSGRTRQAVISNATKRLSSCKGHNEML